MLAAGLRSPLPQGLRFALRSASRAPLAAPPRAPRMASAAAAGGAAHSPGPVTAEKPSGWAAQDSRRMLHAVYRVGDMQAYIEHMQKAYGMRLLRYRDVPSEKYSNAFLGYGPEDTHFALELTYNYGVESYDLGDGFGHFGLAVDDVAKAAEAIRAGGGRITREPGPVKGGQTVIAFAKDPTGYSWELIERRGRPIREPLAQVMLRVGDLQRAVDFYTAALGMRLLRVRENAEHKYTLAFLGYDDEDAGTVFELTYNWGRSAYDLGKGYAQVAISTRDVYKTAEGLRAAGATITREPGPVPGIGTKVVSALDPDGYKVVFVDEADFAAELAAAAAAGGQA